MAKGKLAEEKGKDARAAVAPPAMWSAEDAARVRGDFDNLARFADGGWDHNRHYHGVLLRHTPRGGGDALEIGLGAGDFALELARRCRSVRGIDLSPRMVDLANERAKGLANVHFEVGDFFSIDLPVERYDVIASIATLHHLPLAESLSRLAAALRPGGVLLILDLVQSRGPWDRAADSLALPLSLVLHRLHHGRWRPSADRRAAWDAHGRHERYLTFSQIRALAAPLLPGALLRHHLFWRYSLVWRKQEAPQAVELKPK